MMRVALFAVAAGLLVADPGSGIHPRGDSTDYPAHAATSGATIGAAIIPAGEVRKLFPADLSHEGYVVVEVAVYPAQGKQIKIVQDDFMLRSGSGATTRATSAETIADAITARHAPPPPQIGDDRNVTVATGAGVGTQPGVDPSTGRRMGGGYPGPAVGGPGAQGPSQEPVPPASEPGNAGPAGGDWPPPPQQTASRPQPIPPNHDAIEQELGRRALPEGETSQPVAGYLYFPRPAKVKKNGMELTWYVPEGNVVLSLPGK